MYVIQGQDNEDYHCQKMRRMLKRYDKIK